MLWPQTAFLLHHMHWRMAWYSPMELHNTPMGHIVTLTFLAGINGKKRDLPLTFFMWHIFEKYQLVCNATSFSVPIKETNVRFISAKEGTVGSGYLLSRAFGSVRKAMQTFHSQLKSGTWINDKYHEQHTVWHSWVLDGTQQERTQCYLLWL